jgi:hypothetical protein
VPPKKARTPRPPKVQAPKTRSTPRDDNDRRARLILYALGGSGVLVLAIVLIVIATAGGSGKGSADSKVAAAMKAAGCTLKSVPVLPPKDGKNFHNDSPSLTSNVKWSTFPPSGGGHYGAWAIWDFYRDPVNPRQVVHNEEHGGVIIWWGPKVPAATVDELEAFYRSSPDGMVGTPIAGLGDKIALTAWTGDPKRYYRNHYFGIGHLAICSHFDEKAFKTFRDAYRGKGPEGIPLSADGQGTGPG